MYFSHEDYLGLIDRVNSLTIQNYGYQRDNYALEKQLRQRNDPYWNENSNSIVPFRKPYHGYPYDEKQNMLTPFSRGNSNPLTQLENTVKQQIKMSAEEQMNFIKAQIKKMKVQQSVQPNPSENSKAVNVYHQNTSNPDSQLSGQIKFLYKLWNKGEKQPTANDLCEWINKKNVQAEISKALKEQKKEYSPQNVRKPAHRIEREEEDDSYEQKQQVKKQPQKRSSEKQKKSQRSVAPPPPKRPTQKKVVEKKQEPLRQERQPSETSFLAEEQESVYNQYSFAQDDQYSETRSMNMKEETSKQEKQKEQQNAQDQKKISQRRSVTQQKNPKVQKKTESRKVIPSKVPKQDKNPKLVKKSVTKMQKNTLDKSRVSEKKKAKPEQKKAKETKQKGVSQKKVEPSSKNKEKKIMKPSSKNIKEKSDKPQSAVSISKKIEKVGKKETKENTKMRASFLDLPPKSPTAKAKKTEKKIQNSPSMQKITKPAGSTHKIKKSQHNIPQKSKAKASEDEKKAKVPKKPESSKKMDPPKIKVSKPKTQNDFYAQILENTIFPFKFYFLFVSRLKFVGFYLRLSGYQLNKS